ncbi:unnamed protein product [Orchesella dallaii]|uniref:C2H2-type domain-containing protein n=1 Tax=Orchesella dallaii TaxID=48710 RepID=A0ABP1RIG1_9HEXA
MEVDEATYSINPDFDGEEEVPIDFLAGYNSQNSSNPLPDPLQELSAEQRDSDRNANPQNGYERVTVSCLLCINLVHLNSIEEHPAVIKRRKERLQNLLNHSGIDRNTFQLPEQCTKIKCPLCNQCQQKVDEMWKLHIILENAFAKFNTLVNSVSENLRDKTVLGDRVYSNRVTLSAEAEKFYQLPKAIIELFREKLRQAAALRERDEFNSSGVRPIIISNVEGSVGLTPPTSVTSPNISASNDAGTGSTIEVINRPLKVEANPVQGPHAQDLDFDDDFDVVEIQQRKKRLYGKGGKVEIIPIFRGKEIFLQCSICSHMIPTLKKKTGRKEATALADMNTHIQTQHKREYYTAKKRRAIQGAHKCRDCYKSFRNRNALLDHIRDICNMRGILNRLQKDKICTNASKLSRSILSKRNTSKARGSTSKRVICPNPHCSKVLVGRKHGICHRRSYTTKAGKSNNKKNSSTSPAFSAPSTSAALVQSENRKTTRLGQKSSNASSQQTTPPTPSPPPPRFGSKK